VRIAGILLVVYPTVVIGGASVLWHWITRRTSYYDPSSATSLSRAGHAHAQDDSSATCPVELHPHTEVTE
jgi:hypothetical protein